MPLPQKTSYTTDDIYSLPEGERAELIDGRIYMMAPPGRMHQKLVMELSATIRDYIRRKNGSCEVYPSPFAVFLNKDDKNYVEPVQDSLASLGAGFGSALADIIHLRIPAQPRGAYIRWGIDTRH